MQLLRRGNSGPNVRILKHYLNLLVTPSPRLAEHDARFDLTTERAVITFKQGSGLQPLNGTVDAATWGEIGREFGSKMPPNLPEKTIGRCFINDDPIAIPTWLQNLSLVVVDGPLDFDQSIFIGAYM